MTLMRNLPVRHALSKTLLVAAGLALTAVAAAREGIENLAALAQEAGAGFVVALTAVFAAVAFAAVLVLRGRRRSSASADVLNEELQRNREAAVQFSEQLAILQDVTNQLSKAGSCDDLCRRAVELGLVRLGFERLGIWFIDEALGFMVGSFGTDEEGKIRDERTARVEFRREGLAWQVFSRKEPVACVVHRPLRDHANRVVGEGVNAMAALWDGDRVIGVISVDNLLGHRPISERQLEILRLFATSLAHLITRKRAEDETRRLNQELEHRVTERTAQLEAANESLRASEGRYRRLYEGISEGVLVIDRSGRVTDCNPAACRMVGRSREQLVGALVSDPRWRVIREDGTPFPDDERPSEMVMRTGIPQRGVVAGVPFGESRRIRWLLVNLEPVPDEEHATIEQVVMTFADITARKEAEEALRAANRELEAFSYSVSHDLRAPLRGIDGFSRILLEDYATRLDEEGRDCLRRVRAASQRMGLLIDDVLQLSRTARAEMNCTTVDLSALAQEVIDGLRREEPARLVECIIAPGLVVFADAALLRVVLENLLGNAWKFTARRERAVVEVGATIDERGCASYVRDNGAGFDMAYAHKLFRPFQRLHTMEEFPGTGVDLATAQRIIHRHGGRIWAEGTVDAGATFYFTLPENPVES